LEELLYDRVGVVTNQPDAVIQSEEVGDSDGSIIVERFVLN